MRKPPDPIADAWDNLCADRFRDMPERLHEGVTCPVCGESCFLIGGEAIELQPDGNEWKHYRLGRRFWHHEDKTCITEHERGRPQDGDVRSFGAGARSGE